MRISNIVHDYHRNGVCGAGFYVCKFNDDENGPMMAVLFPTGEDDGGPVFDWQDGDQCAVFQRDKIGAGVIAFGRNSWRGDHYSGPLVRHIRAAYKADEEWDEAMRVAIACWGIPPVWSWERRREVGE